MTEGIHSRQQAHRCRSRVVKGWFGLCLLAGPILLAGRASAQDRTTVPPPALGASGNGIVTPPARLAPGMAHAAPRQPARSTPVLHPRTRDSHGVRIVPK